MFRVEQRNLQIFSCYGFESVEKFLDPPSPIQFCTTAKLNVREQIKQHCLRVGGMPCSESVV